MRRKNYILVLFSLLILCTTLIFGGTALKFIQGHSQSDNVIIEWQTEKEVNVRYFAIERQTPSGSFVQIGTINPQGDYSYYKFVDEGVYKTTDKIYVYRLSIDDGSGNPAHSAPVSVTMGSVSGVKRTWGSIKALFR